MGRVMSEIVELRDRPYAGCESGMRRHVSNALAVEQHGSAIAQAAHILSAAASHKAPFEKSPGPKPRRCLAFEAA
jgi:hypothetical protein